VVIANSILWGNRARGVFDDSAQLSIMEGNAVVDYSCIEGWSGILGGDGNIGDDPVFIDADGPDNVRGTADDDYRLGAGSACIDAADNASLPPESGVDVRGALRRTDDPQTPDVGNAGVPGTPVVDMGAYEYQEDCNANGVFDSVDIAGGEAVDCDDNGAPDLCDVRDGRTPDRNKDTIPDFCEDSVVYVDAAASGGDNGRNWTDAYSNLHDALAHAKASGGNVKEIWVASGVYRPGLPGDREASFSPVGGVTLYGGFAGDESSLAERNVEAFTSVLSGDLAGDDAEGFANRGDNAFHVITAIRRSALAVVDGFTIKGGFADKTYPDDRGAGLFAFGGALTFRNCTFTDNAADRGGAVSLDGASGGFENSDFIHNAAFSGGGAVYIERFAEPVMFGGILHGNDAPDGGALYVAQSALTISGAVFTGNTAAARGGAMFNDRSDTVVEGCTFRGNSQTAEEGEDDEHGGGAVYNHRGRPRFSDTELSGNTSVVKGGAVANYRLLPGAAFEACLFEDNSAADGGAVHEVRSADVVYARCRFRENRVNGNGGAALLDQVTSQLESCLFDDNDALGGGGAVYCASGIPGFDACTFTGNHASGGGGAIYLAAGGSATIRSSILWNNGRKGLFESEGSALVEYSDIEGGWNGVATFDADPLFVDAEAGDYRLLAGSPCANTGDPTYAPATPAKDLSGGARVRECRVDMGAFESPYFVDCDGDATSDACQIATGQGSDCNANSVLDTCEPDCNGNGYPDDCDVSSGESADCNENVFPDECEPDCNDSGMPDDCDIVQGLASDCNRNGVPDECDIDAGDSADCNTNGIPDQCDLGLFAIRTEPLSPIGADAPQSVLLENMPEAIDDVIVGLSASADLNDAAEWLEVGIHGTVVGRIFESAVECPATPDEVEIVVPAALFNSLLVDGEVVLEFTASGGVNSEACDSASFVQAALWYQTAAACTDCNFNEVPDECEIGPDPDLDCNANGVPDVCDQWGNIVLESGELSPIGVIMPQQFRHPAAPAAVSEVSLALHAVANLSGPQRWIDVDLNGAPVGRAFALSGSDCPAVPDTDELIVPAETFNAAVAEGEIVLGLQPSGMVSPFACGGSPSVSVAVAYLGVVHDCNGNGELDECEIARGSVQDLNQNGAPDACEHLGDFNADGVVNLVDFASFVECVGTALSGTACEVFDFDGDQRLSLRDLGLFQRAFQRSSSPDLPR
jgi:predicted outer membrane repeat protein